MSPPHRPWAGSVATAALVLSLAAALTGCNDTERASPPPRTSTSPSPSTPSATPTPPPMPDAATKPGKKGAEAFVRYYYAVMDYAQSTSNTRQFQTLSANYCTPCNTAIKAIKKIYANDGSIEGGTHSIANLTSERLGQTRHGAVWRVRSDMLTTEQYVQHSAHAQAERYGGDELRTIVYLLQHEGIWVVTDWRIQ